MHCVAVCLCIVLPSTTASVCLSLHANYCATHFWEVLQIFDTHELLYLTNAHELLNLTTSCTAQPQRICTLSMRNHTLSMRTHTLSVRNHTQSVRNHTQAVTIHVRSGCPEWYLRQNRMSHVQAPWEYVFGPRWDNPCRPLSDENTPPSTASTCTLPGVMFWHTFCFRHN